MIYVDLDGTLADFDLQYYLKTGVYPGGPDHDEVNWDWVREENMFFATMPWLPEGKELWGFVAPFHPTILTGIPHTAGEQAAAQKRCWVSCNLGPSVPVITCLSKEKCKHCRYHNADILVDDRNKYRDLWEERGGIWVPAGGSDTIDLLKEAIIEQARRHAKVQNS